jgi:AcrR family transcriptional regulator
MKSRTVKAYSERRREILEAAQRLLYARGYEQMAIQDILDELAIAKGTFYHYFDSKQALLEALVEQMIDKMEQVLLSLIQNTELSAVEKLQRYFAEAVQWKNAQVSYLLAFMRVWYKGDNAIVHQKIRTTAIKRIAPLFKQIIQQGTEEGSMKVSHPDQAGGVLLALLGGLEEALVMLLLAGEARGDDLLSSLASTVAAYTEALERVLGLAPASLSIVDVERLKVWVTALRDPM